MNRGFSYPLCLAFAAQTAFASLNPDETRGEKIIKFDVPGRQRQEICVIPKHIANTSYGDKDVKREKKLCELNFYESAAVCPKLNSTNPGLDIHDIPEGFTLKQVTDNKCEIKDPNQEPGQKKPKDLAKKIAKYKLSTSCSYTPSILAYYHVSRFLGDVLNVPVAVLRTVDLRNHIAWGNLALKESKPNDTIHITWASLMQQLTKGAGASRKDYLLTNAADQSYGALVEAPKKDFFYKEFFNGGVGPVRTQNFMAKNPIFAQLAKSGPVSVGRDFNADNLQRMVQLRDAANMIVLDSLLSQEDRMGNIAYYNRYFLLDDKEPTADGQATLKSFDEKGLKKAQIDASKTLQVKEMLLKDNDCGVSRDNIDRKFNLTGKIAHIDPTVYQNLLRMNAVADQPEFKSFFLTELVFSADDFQKYRKNVADVTKQLHDACVQKRLSLDLDLQSHFSGKTPEQPSCELKDQVPHVPHS